MSLIFKRKFVINYFKDLIKNLLEISIRLHLRYVNNNYFIKILKIKYNIFIIRKEETILAILIIGFDGYSLQF